MDGQINTNLGFCDLSWEEIGEVSKVISKYKQWENNTVYLGKQQVWGPYCLTDIVNDSISGKHTRGERVTIGQEKYFSVHSAPIHRDIQLAINRILAPFMPITPLLRIWKTDRSYSQVVSIDVNDKNAASIMQLKSNILEETHRFFRFIYQFITEDGDRVESKDTLYVKSKKLLKRVIPGISILPNIHGHNIENGIIYDFGGIFNYRGETIWYKDKKISWNSLSEKQIKDFAEILYFFREYIVKYCNESLNNSNISEEMKKYFELLRVNAGNLSAINLGLSAGVGNDDIPHLSKIDSLLKKKYSS